MRTADWALAISVLAVLIAFFNFAWNVWSKFIFPKPHFRVNLSVVRLIELGSASITWPTSIRLTATNHGPISANLSGVVIRLRDRRGNIETGIPQLLTHPFVSSDYLPNAGFPKAVAVGEDCNAYLDYRPDSVWRHGVFRIGVSDGFGRTHWAPRRGVHEVIKSLQAAFPEAWTQAELDAAGRSRGPPSPYRWLCGWIERRLLGP